MSEMEEVPREPLSAPIYVNKKGETRAKLHEFILSFCDTDIQQEFKAHSFTIEPLLMQLIREIGDLKRSRNA